MDHNRTQQLAHDGHRYRTVSTHNTSEGRVAYQRCGCGVWHIELFGRLGESALQASVARQQNPVEPVEDAPVEVPSRGNLAMAAHVVSD